MKLADTLGRLEGVRPCAGGYIAFCPAHDDRKASLSIRQAESGKVLIYCFVGCEYHSIIDALDGRPWSLSPGSVGASHLPTAAIDDAKRIDFARRIWREAQNASGAIVETYLRSRGLTMAVPPSLRFHPSIKHPSGVLLPAMIAAVQNVDGRIVAIHRTFMRLDGSGKADVEPQKAMFGPCSGGAVRFAKPSETVAIAEGIETALSIAQACPDLAVWAALSTSGIRAVKLADVVREVVLCVDADAAGEQAANAATQRFVREGRHVRIARPVTANDFNDMLRF